MTIMINGYEENCLAVDFGGTKLMIGIVDQKGSVLDYEVSRTGFVSQSDAYETIMNRLDAYLKDHPIKDYHITSVGMGLVGQVDYENGIWENMYGSNEDAPIEICQIISKKYDISCRIDNDVKAATHAELILGEGKKTNNFAYVNVGTGISAGLVCNGSLLRGHSNNAGEIGFYPSRLYYRETGRCYTIEDLASGRGMITRYREAAEAAEVAEVDKGNFQNKAWEKDGFTAGDIFSLALEGDTLAQQVVNAAQLSLVDLCEYIICTCSPDSIIFGGGVIRGEHFISGLKEKLSENPMSSHVTIRKTQLNTEWIGLIGAGMIGFDNYMHR